MGATVTVVAGPARSGKTVRVLSRYRERLASGMPGQTLWLAPTQRGAAEIEGQLLAGALQACFSPGVTTFERFAETVLDASEEEIRPISLQIKRQLVRRLLESAADAGQLKHFASIAHTDGLIDLIAGWISEMKRLEIWPEHFEEACRARGITAKDRELVLIYKQYQEALTRHRLYDLEGRFWSARALLQTGPIFPTDRLRFVVADGFTDFTRTQHEILEILAGRCEELVITLPLEPEPRRSDLFAKTLHTLALLEQRHPTLKIEHVPRAKHSDWPALAHIERQIFKHPHQVEPLPHSERVEILAASRQRGEIELIARRVKQLLTGDNIAPGHIAIVYRLLADNASLVREVFTEYGIPFAIETAQCLADAPAMKALVSLIQLEAEDWPFRQVLALLNHNYFQPDWPEWRDGKGVLAADRIVRQLQIPYGREALLRAVAQLAKREAERESLAENQTGPGPAQLAHQLLARLAQTLGALQTETTQTEWSQAIETLAQETGLLRAMRTPPDSPACEVDQVAWERLTQALSAGDKLAQWLGEAPTRLTLAEALDLVSDILRWEALPRACDEVGRVRVLSAASARALRFDYLFLAGLSEKAFPPPDREDRLYNEGDYQRLIEAGLPLVDNRRRAQEEMLLFYELLTRPGHQLWLSYPALDEAAQPLLPSSFLLEVERACGPNVLPRYEEADLVPIPREPVPLGPGDLRLKSLANAFDGDATLLAALLRQETAPGLAANLRAGLQTTYERSRGNSFGPLEGIFSSPSATHLLAERFGPDHLWSPSQLEQYAYCPHRFFLERVLGIEPVEELALEVDYRQRGFLLHETLARFHRRLNELSGRPTSPASLSEAEFLQLFQQVLESLIPTGPGQGLESAAREIDRRLLTRWGEKYHQQHAKYDASFDECQAPPRPTHFEVSFGPARSAGEDESRDSLSITQPLVVTAGDESFLFAGRIDRIDLGQAGGAPIFNVLDYKSGASSSLRIEDVEAGLALQLPLYVMAVEAMLLTHLGAKPWQAAYWFVRETGYSDRRALAMHECLGGQLQPLSHWETLRETLLTRIQSLVHGIRAGEFPMISADEHCTGQCEFKTVCRVGQTRWLEKTWSAPISISTTSSFPRNTSGTE